MRQLIIMRHGKSGWDNPGLSDIERPLKKRGVKEAALVAKELKSLGVLPEVVITSPAIRARDTAIIVAQNIGFDFHNLTIEPSIYGASAEDILHTLGLVGGASQSIMIFGHNPTFTQLINKLQDKYLDNLPTCGCVGFDVDVGSWSNASITNSKKVFEVIPSQLKHDQSGKA